jgi:tetratricopeptide (TPR) repeat protein
VGQGRSILQKSLSFFQPRRRFKFRTATVAHPSDEPPLPPSDELPPEQPLLRRSVPRDDDPLTDEDFFNLLVSVETFEQAHLTGKAFEKEEHFARAEMCFRRAVAIAQARAADADAKGHRDPFLEATRSVAVGANSLALLYRKLSAFEDAEGLFAFAIGLFDSLADDADDAERAAAVNNLAGGASPHHSDPPP